jgi:hypothetical protein
VAWPARSPYLNPSDVFLWGCMKSRVHHNGKAETRYQLMEAIDRAAVVIINELERMQ